MSSAGDLKINLILALQLNFAIVEPSRKVHRAINAKEGVVIEALNFGGVKLCEFDARLERHSFSLVLESGACASAEFNYTGFPSRSAQMGFFDNTFGSLSSGQFGLKSLNLKNAWQCHVRRAIRIACLWLRIPDRAGG